MAGASLFWKAVGICSRPSLRASKHALPRRAGPFPVLFPVPISVARHLFGFCSHQDQITLLVVSQKGLNPAWIPYSHRQRQRDGSEAGEALPFLFLLSYLPDGRGVI